MKIVTFVLLSFLSIRVSAQLTLNGTPLLSSPGTYSEAIVLPPDAVLSVSGSGDYTLSGVISDRITQHPTLLQMHSGTGTDYLGGRAEVTSSRSLNRDFQGWKCINNSTYGEWISRWADGGLWLQVQYGVPVIITSAELRSRPNSSGTITHWGIEGSADGTAWSTLYSSANVLPGHAITTVAWSNTTAYTYYRFYGLSSNAPDTNFNPMNINYFYGRNQGLSRFQLLGDRAPTPSNLTVQAGSGKIILTGANTYSGTTTISTGTLQAGNGGPSGTLGTGAVTIANQAALTINRSEAVTLSNTISGSGALIQQGTGSTLLTAANTYTGGTTLNGGILKAGHLTALGTGQAAINSGATLDIRGGFSAITNTITNNGGTLLRDNGLYLNGRWLTSYTNTPYSGDIVLTQNSTFTQTGAGTYILSGVISGQYGITTDTGAGNTLLLTGANTYGGTTISTGTLQTGDGGPSGTLGTGAITIAGQAALTINRSDEVTLSNTISGSGILIQQGPGTTRLTAANTCTGGTVINGGILKAGCLTALSTGAITLNSGTTLDLRGGFSTITNALTNNGGTLLRDDGLYLNNALLTTHTDTPYSEDILLTRNSTLIQAGAGTYTLSGVISGEYEITSDIGAGNTLLLTGANTYSGTTTIRSGTLQTGTGGTTGTLGTGVITIAADAVLKINRSDEVTLSNTISGSGSLIQQGPGTTRLTAANTCTGGTVINGGLLKAGHLTAFSTGAVVINSGAVLDLRGGFSAITNTNTITNNGGTLLRDDGLYLNDRWLTSDTNAPYSGNIVLTQNSTFTQTGAGTYTLSGVISGEYGITTDTGEGNTLLLTGANTYGGTTTIRSGTLQTGTGGTTGTLGTGAITIAGHAVLKINRSNEITLPNIISGRGSLIQQGPGTTRLTAANTYTGGTTINGGILKAGHLTAFSTGAVMINSGAALDLRGGFSAITNTHTITNNGAILRDDGLYLNDRWLTSDTHVPYSTDIALTRHSTLTQTGAGTYTLSGVISGEYEITTDIGIGNTLLLTGANTYSTTTITSGTLQTGKGGTTGTLGTGAITIADQAALKINRSNEITLSNTISGSGTLIQQGPGTTRLTGANTYTGGTVINEGILKAAHLTAFGTGAITINSGATLDIRGGFSTLTNTITNNGGTLLRDNGLYLNDRWLTSDTHLPCSADIVLTRPSILTQTGPGTYTISGVISGGYGITSDIGEGNTLLLTGANTYSTTTIRSGTLQTGNGGTTGTLGTGAITIANHAALKINRSNEITLSHISGSGLLIQQGTGTTLLATANTYTGGTTINGGALKAGTLASFGTETIALNTSAVLDLTGGLGNIANTVTNTGGTILRDNGLFLNGEWLTSNTNAPYSADIVLTRQSVFTQLAAGTYTISGVISGGYGITGDTGAGNTLLLTGANTYSGPTTISSGTLQTGHGETGTLGTGAITIAGNAVLKINRSNEITLSNSISGSGTLTQQGTGKTILSAANTYTGATTVLSGELSISGTLTSPVTIKSGALLSSGVTGTIENTVLAESGGALQAGNAAVGTLTINGLLTLQNNAVLNVYSSHADVSKIITPSTPIAGTLTVNLKTPMTAGTYTLLQTSGSVTATVTPGENSTTLYCISYSWGTDGLQLTANNNTSIVDAQVSGGGKITSAASTGLSVLLSSSQTGVTYTLYRTINNTTSAAAAMAGTGQALTFGGLGAGGYIIKGSQGNCIRPMTGTVTITTDGTVIKDRLAQNHIPEAVKVSLTGDALKAKHTPYYLNQLIPSFQAKVIGECHDTNFYYAGFQLSYDGSDQNTAADWAAQLSISLVKGTVTTKLTDSLKVDLGTQTFETTTFFQDSIRCADNYEFIINSKTVKGRVPAGTVRLYILLYKIPDNVPDMPSTTATAFTCTNGNNNHIVINNNTVKVAWSRIANADEYDLEWAFIDDYDNFSSGNAEAFSFQEPVRVTVKEWEYTHQVYYPRGKIYYRVRPVGHEKTNPAQRLEGAWAYHDPIAITNHNSERSWQQQTIFAEDGKYKKVMSYYDATGRLRQQQTNLSSENSTLTAETMYDFEGRKALTVMPVPETGNSLHYKDNLNPFPAGTDVQEFVSPTRKKYHYDNGRLANSVLDSTAAGGAAHYYSSLNSMSTLHHDHLPKAAGYAYTQTEYTRDGTGRISRQSGLGKELNIDGPHAMRYYYGSAAAEELRRLFGDKVGEASHYKKDVTVDANGQAAVTYKDQEGRTIATALAGAPPANVENLASYPEQSAPVNLSLTGKNSKKNGLSETVHTFINTAPNSTLTINYTWAARAAQLPDACQSCGYQLRLELTDPNGEKVSLGNPVGDQDPGPSYSQTQSASSCTADTNDALQFTPVVLAETGDYTLRKTLTPTILSYAQMRESVRLLSSTETYRNSLKTANPVNYDVCEDCKNCDKEALIDASIAEVAGKNCQRILDTLEANWKKNPLGFDDFNNYLKVPANNKLICKYNYCINNIESTKFDTKLATIEDWTEVERRGWNRIELLLAADPYFRDTVFRDTMIEKMNSVGILNFEYNANGTNDEKTASKRNITGPIDNVTDPLNTTYFIDKYGRSSGTGYHFLYYDLKQKRVDNKITQKEYDSCLSRQRWSLYRQYYNEGKRKIKIEETAGCDSMQAELKKQDRLPQTENEIIDRASKQNSDADRLIQAGMTVLAFKISCARGLTTADSTAISQRLFNYFKSRPYNLMYVIDEKDYAIDPVTQKCKNSHLEAVRALLDKNYNCKLSDFAAKNPTECLRDTTIYYTSDPEPAVRRPRHMSISLAEEESEDEDRERAMEETESGERGAGIRQAAGTGQSGTGTEQSGAGTGQSGTGTEQSGAGTEQSGAGTGQSGTGTEQTGTGTEQSGAGTGQSGTGTGQTGAESEEEENTGVENAFLQAGTGAAQQLTPIAEVNALIALYNATQGNQWENTTKLWRSTRIGLMPPVTVDTDISNWYGVGLDDGGHLVSLNLFFNNLNGTLPGSLSVCTRLKVLNLGYNPNLTGHLQTFRNMPALEELNLSYDQFSGSLSSLSDCVNLKELDLSETQLSGNLSGLFPCTKLKQIRLSGNQFTGSISLLGRKEELEEFYLVANRGAKLSGNLSIFKDCSKLRVLNLFGNELDGSLAELVGSKSKPVLEVLDFYSNKLRGDLSGLSGYTNLRELTLSRNEFTGSINTLGQLTNLEKVLLSRNHFSGSLSGLLNCSRLRHLEIRDNEFTFTDLQTLSGHTFTGPFRYSPQAAVDTDQRIECRLGEPFTLTTDIDRSTTTPCTYQWFKKIGSGEPIPLNTESAAGHTCLFTPEIADKEAELYYIIKNENFRDLTLTSQKRKLRIAYTYCLKWSLHPEAPAAKLWDFDVKEQKRKCRAVQEAMAAGYVERMVDTYIDEKTSQLLIKRDSTCLKNAAETLDITYTNKEHHYTLYYYDQAGNLVQTVPPQGVQTAAAGNPPHTLKTTYRYNAQNQVVEQTTPDAGTSHFYYNKKGQLRFSQNAQQALESRYAYTKYDAQGRITETGEATQIDLEQMEESEYPQANRTDVTHTHYDAPARRSLLNQKYLRSRVSYTETIEKNTTDTTRTYYSYDPHGSVNILLQKLPGLPPKTTHYRYDLVSGKVNYVFYQYKKPDQFVHRYTYDSDNRIREVFTSADRYVWHKDAAYQYYLHGPLATTELGHWRNQAMNYTYTLQGWIKGVNTIAATDNMVGQSVMSYQLGYYKNDYKPIGAAQNNVTLWTRANETLTHQGLYNGNISWMETDLKLFKKPQAMLYKYDQLNRITKSRSLEFSNGNYAARTGDKKYDENYTYDANGNILTLQRRDNAATLADDFNYSYYPNSNKLLKHKTTGGTYIYDAIGNLITDNNENLQIAWTPSGKVRSVTKPDTTIYFRYDATGNRILKIVSTTSKNDTTTYVRDASGNVMSIYRNRVVSEVPIYGSSRLGEYMGKEKEGYQTFNLRKYQITNQLENVLAVISDKVNLYSHGLVVNNQLVLDSARATVVSASDYYPFGLAMKGREFSSSTYRYGFNGHEKDDEIAGLGTHMSWGDYGMDTRLGRRWQPDPNWQKLSGQSPYAVNNNSPVLFYDPDGNWAIFLHYRFTKNALGKAGISLENARRIAHYASVYADNPMGTPQEKNAFKINQVLSAIEFMGKTDRSLLRLQSDINYSPTAGSQSDKNDIVQKWHGTRTVSQAEAGITAEMAMANGREFGWGKIFDAANSGNLDESTMANFGQGMHALQDTERHKGAIYSEDKKSNEHSLIGDWLGNRSSSKEISNSAAKVFSIISGIGDIGKHGRITTTGMSSEQRGQLLNKLGSSGYSYTERQGKIKYTKN